MLTKVIDPNWLKRRFLEFRNGHSIYLIFAVQFIQFIVVTYGLYIADHPGLQVIFPTIYHWVAVFVLLYLPAAIYVGHQHLTKQYKRETEQIVRVDPYTWKPTPGKEMLFQYPAAVLGYDISLKMMAMLNELGDGKTSTRFTKADFDQMESMKRIAIRLGKGENILDILANKSA